VTTVLPPGRWWTSPDHSPEGVRIRVGATHRKLSTVLNACLTPGWKPSVSSSRQLRFRRICYGGAATAD
jgi:hypothetical protein